MLPGDLSIVWQLHDNTSWYTSNWRTLYPCTLPYLDRRIAQPAFTEPSAGEWSEESRYSTRVTSPQVDWTIGLLWHFAAFVQRLWSICMSCCMGHRLSLWYLFIARLWTVILKDIPPCLYPKKALENGQVHLRLEQIFFWYQCCS